MDPNRTITELCRKYGVPREFGKRLLPLLERARAAPRAKRRRLTELVERSFAEEARRLLALPSPRDLQPEEWGVVKTVAGVLHAWDPPIWLRLWGQGRRRR